VVFALANPDPEVDPVEAARYAAVVATGRSDFTNQINNVLAFPGVFRGLLDAQSRTIGTGMLLAAARALAAVVADDELNPAYIVPSVFHPDVTRVVAGAVERAARAATGAHSPAEGGRGPVHDIAGHDIPGHEMAGHEMAGHDIPGHEIAGHDLAGHVVEAAGPGIPTDRRIAR